MPHHTLLNATVAELPARIAEREATIDGLRPHCASQLHLSKGPEGVLRQTDLVILYLHGFSASPQEIQPLPNQLAAALGANLYIPRLSGHGLDGEALASVCPEQWQQDAAEAFQVAKVLGKQVVVMGTSTGATLAFWLALQKEMSDSLAALLLISPNFASHDPRGEWLRHWWGRLLFRLSRGPLHGVDPLSERHGRFWTTYFPVKAVSNLMNLVALLRETDFSPISTPCLVAYAPADQVVDVRPIERKFSELGSASKVLLKIENSDDPLQHVIAGDIRSPATTGLLLAGLLKFLDSVGISARR